MIHAGHVHTPYCPHGTIDALADYCEAAIRLGIKGITFSEHAPLPPSFSDPTPSKDSAMERKQLERYVEEIERLKQEYAGKLTILTGLEVDYIEGYEEETTAFLKEIGPHLDDSILSVHFLKIDSSYICIDYSPEAFAEAVRSLGSVDDVYRQYFATVARSIEADLGRYKPKRIGHITLVRKFRKQFEPSASFEREIANLLALIKKHSYELDYNGAGVVKPLCGETYPCETIAERAAQLGIPLVYGSDAHQVKALMSGVKELSPNVSLTMPSVLRDRGELFDTLA